jgi:membrane fusion protein (multidrug efflux system)
MLKKPVTWIVLLLICMLVFVYWPTSVMLTGKGRTNKPSLVETQVVSKQLLKDEIRALGTTQANESIILTTQSTDRVSVVHFDDSDSVKKGQLIVALAHAEEQALVKELEIKFTEQKRQLQRLLDINKTSAPAQSAIDSQKSLMESTLAQLSVAKIKLSEKFVYAPFSGVLGLRKVSPGQLLTTSTEITTLDDLSQIKVEFELPEKYLNRVRKGQQVSAKNIAYAKSFTGSISSIASRLDKATRSFKVRAIFPNKKLELRAGMLLELVVETKSVEVLTVPEEAIIPINVQHYVYQVIDNKVKRVLVETGRRKPGVVEIISGLVEGDTVVSRGVIKVRDGSTIVTANKSVKE